MPWHKKIRGAWPAVFIVVAVILFIATLAVGTGSYYQMRVLPKTYVAGTSISNLSLTDAQAASGQIAKRIQSQPITITFQGKTITATPEQMGVSVQPNTPASDPSPKHWLTYNYWHDFFVKKEVALAYVGNNQKLATYIDTAFSLTATPVNANLTIANGTVAVVPGQNGEVVDIGPLTAALKSSNVGSIISVTLTSQESAPQITTDNATVEKAQIDSSILPVYLINNGQTVTVPASDVINLLAITTDSNQITWQVDKTKLTSYITSIVGKKVNIAMLPQQIKSDTGQVLVAGNDGSQVDATKLTTSVLSAITNHSDTKTAPLAVPMTAIAMTTKTIYPDYQAGMFPGLYVYVNLTSQTMYILNSTDLQQTFQTSTGAGNTPTPPGQYYIYNKIPMPRSPLYNALWMPHWNGLSTDGQADGFQGYGVHALPCFDINCKYVEGSRDLGVPVSHGCIRLSNENAAWFYDNIPIGTPVYVSK